MPTPTSLSTSITAGTGNPASDANVVHGVVNNITIVATTSKTANYTFALSDSGEIVEANSASALTFTVPPNSTVAFPTGTVIGACRYGAGTLTIAAGAGVTILPGTSLTARAQYSEISLRKRATNEWIISGDLT